MNHQRWIFKWFISLAIIFATRITFAADNTPATQPAPDNDELTRPGSILVARWDALLNDKSADAIESLGTPKQSDSKLYHALIFDAAALRGALNKSHASRDTLATGRGVAFGKSFSPNDPLEIDPSFFIRLMARGSKRVTLEIDQSTPAVFDRFDPPAQNEVHIVLQHPDLKLTLTELPQKNTPATQPAEQSIIYDGPLKPGEALGFLGTYTGESGTNYHHLVVWEAFRAESWQASSFQGGASGVPTDWWIANGPQKMRTLADIALVWAARAKHAPDAPPAAFSVVLPNGAGVQILGFSRPSKYNLCWWDGAGDPIAPMHTNIGSYGARDTGLHYTIQFHASTSEPNTPLPTGSDSPRDQDWQMVSAAVRTTGPIKFVLGEGPWKQLGEINSDTPLKVDNVTYTITNKDSRGDRFARIQYTRTASSNDLMALTAVSNDGSEVGSFAGAFAIDAINTRTGVAMFNNLALDQVKTFHLWLRKGHIVTFNDYAQSPNQNPPPSVTPDEVLAASKIVPSENQ
jgi:hypothetical protein